METAATMQLEHGHQRELRWLHLRIQHLLEKFLASRVLVGMSAAFQEMGVDDVVWLVACCDHVVEEGKGAVQGVAVDHGLDEHRVRDDIRTCTFALLHLFAKVDGAVQAVRSNEALDEESAHDRVQGTLAVHQKVDEKVDDLVGDTNLVVRDAEVQQSAESDGIRLNTLGTHLVQTFKATLGVTVLGEAFDDGVVGDNVNDRLPHALGLVGVRVSQHLEGSFRLLGVHAGEQEEVQHQVGSFLAQFVEHCFSSIGVLQGLICSEEQDVILSIKFHLRILVEEGAGFIRHADLEGRIDQARQNDLVQGHLRSEDCNGVEAGGEVLTAGKHLQSGLPEFVGWDQFISLHRLKHALNDIGLSDADCRLNEGRVEFLAECDIAAISLQSAEEVEGPCEFTLLEML
mmetsp:Transcript_38039/g.80544  ORF Transcript_38039/g.80544 Transcript_38039/m.80544 type:complete len:401 (-) Transcript_38039:675-1877(-)